MKHHPAQETNPAKVALLEAAKDVLLTAGYAGLSTRAVAAAAGTQMSQIRYHFGSKDGMVLELYHYMTAQLISRQSDLFLDPDLSLSAKWDMACDYLDIDLASGYVRVLQELIAVCWSNPQIGEAVKSGLDLWRKLHLDLAREFQAKHGSLGPFEAEDLAALVGPVFIGAEAYILLGFEAPEMPVRRALRRLGRVIAYFEDQEKSGE
ncbi:MAG: TetR/AcrR family transcriptional regulator [Hoeflea sp.]|uniref:TetR/AcrR family transcriptional regulator n=1 Tax=Hoeflea sp. TaxID=1940281 RepID=UPI003EF4443B